MAKRYCSFRCLACKPLKGDMMTITENDIEGAFVKLAKAMETLFEKSEEELVAKENLKATECGILLTNDPKTLGSNEAIRAAKLREMTTEAATTLSSAEKETLRARLFYGLSELELNCLIWRIKMSGF